MKAVYGGSFLNYFFAALEFLGRRRAVLLGAGLVTACNTLGIQSTTDDVVTHTGEVPPRPPRISVIDGVLLQVMADTGNKR